MGAGRLSDMHRRTRLLSSALTLTLALVGTACASPDDELSDGGPVGEDQEVGKADIPTGNGSVISTANGNARLHDGYHVLFDKTHSECVAPLAEQQSAQPFVVGDVQRAFDLVFVNSRAELARELGIDLGLKVKYPAVGVDVGFGLLDNFASTTTSASFLMKITEEYFVRNNEDLQLNEVGVGALQEGANAFVRKCGTHYTNGLRYGGHLYVLITYKATDEQTANEIKANLGVDVGYGPGKVTGDMKAKLASHASRQGVNVTMRVSTRGFMIGESKANESVIENLLGGGVNEQTFEMLDQIRVDMQKSVARDVCRDTGEGTCADGSTAPGYFANPQRLAKPSGVEIGFYDALPNADVDVDSVDGVDPFELILTKLTAVERYIRDFAELEERMTEVYQSEIRPFESASTSRKAGFNVTPPADPLHDPRDLADVADDWIAEFYPQIGPQIGWGVQLASEAIVNCWTAASVSVEHECGEDGLPGYETEAWTKLEALLEEYRDEARILPLRYVVGPAVTTQKEARDACSDLELSGEAVRLPTRDEVQYLAPLVGFGNVKWKGTHPNEVWYQPAESYQGCADTAERKGYPHAFYENLPAHDGPEFRCAQPKRVIQTVCVPNSGPLPILAEP